MKYKDCSCHKQIVWFFEKPTVIVCEKCEKTFHYSDEKCDICGGVLTEYQRKEDK